MLGLCEIAVAPGPGGGDTVNGFIDVDTFKRCCNNALRRGVTVGLTMSLMMTLWQWGVSYMPLFNLWHWVLPIWAGLQLFFIVLLELIIKQEMRVVPAADPARREEEQR